MYSSMFMSFAQFEYYKATKQNHGMPQNNRKEGFHGQLWFQIWFGVTVQKEQGSYTGIVPFRNIKENSLKGPFGV